VNKELTCLGILILALHLLLLDCLQHLSKIGFSAGNRIKQKNSLKNWINVQKNGTGAGRRRGSYETL